MKINWDTTFLDLEGKPVKHSDDKDMTLKNVSMTALCQMTKQDESLSGIEKYDLGALADKIRKHPDEDYTGKEVETIKKRIGFLYSPTIIFQAYEMLK
jgi:hypothetical protein